MSDNLTETPAVVTQEQPAADSLPEVSSAPENTDQDGQDEQQPDLDSQLEKQIDEVDLSKFDLSDLEDYQEAVKDLTLKKRKAYEQAKKERLAREALQKEIDELRSSYKMAEHEELAALKAELAAKETAQRELENQLQAEKSRQADLMFKHAAEIHKAKETDFLRFKLNEHLKNADLESFNVTDWMSEMKQNHKAMFDDEAPQAPERKPANTTNNMQTQPAGNTNYQSGVADKLSVTVGEKRARDNEWQAYLAKNNLK